MKYIYQDKIVCNVQPEDCRSGMTSRRRSLQVAQAQALRSVALVGGRWCPLLTVNSVAPPPGLSPVEGAQSQPVDAARNKKVEPQQY